MTEGSQSISEETFVKQNPHLTKRPYYHNGVWWSQVYPGYSRPAFKYRTLAPNTARPMFARSWLGHSHFVPEEGIANAHAQYMVIENDDLRSFCLEQLSSKKRNQVRKGLKCCDVKRITDIETCIEETQDICISHSTRGSVTREKYHVSEAFFTEQADTWKAQMRRDFNSDGRIWMGAWQGNRLVAYVVTLQVENTMIIEKAKSHTDFLQFCPSDALYFRVLEAAATNETCTRIFNSRPQRPGIDRFKKQFLFSPTLIPMYISNVFLYDAGKCLVRFLRGRH